MSSRSDALAAVLERRGTLVVNTDYRIHLGRWERVLAAGIPSHLYASFDAAGRRLVLRVPGLTDSAKPGELRVEVHRQPTRACVYLPVAALAAGGALSEVGVRVGSLLDVTYGVTSMTLQRIR
jgi:hypothetical protein